MLPLERTPYRNHLIETPYRNGAENSTRPYLDVYKEKPYRNTLIETPYRNDSKFIKTPGLGACQQCLPLIPSEDHKSCVGVSRERDT